MKELNDYLKSLGKKSRIADSFKDTKYDSFIEMLLTAFNNNPHNSSVVDYISRSNYFDLIGKSRHEMVHSRIISELLAGRYFEISKNTTLLHFFDIVLMRAKEQNVDIPKEFSEAVLTRTIHIDSLADKQVEYPLTSYLSTYTKNKNSDIDSRNRLDIYLRYNLETGLKAYGRRCVEVFIENKVLSQEHDNQTQIYYDNCVNGRQALQFFIYLSPISPRELAHYKDIDDRVKPIGSDKQGNRVYVHISYQDILDRIIMPLLQDKRMNDRDRLLMEEYVNCLELPAMSDDEEIKIGAKELSIMAVSNEETQLLDEFMRNPDNQRLMEIAISHKLGKKMYSYDSDCCMTFEHALEQALSYHTKCYGELKSIKDFREIIGKGGARFLIYAVKETDDKLYYIPTHLFEYSGKAYKNITDALKVAVKDYISRERKTISDVIKDFECIYERQKYHQHIFKDNADSILDVHYSQTSFAGLYIRDGIDQDKISMINDILANGFEIKSISDRCYHELLMSGDDSLWESYDKKLYHRVGDSNFFYRPSSENKLDKINSLLSTPIKEQTLSKEDVTLIDNFCKTNRNLILSVYRILIENEHDLDIYNLLQKEYKRLVRNS